MAINIETERLVLRDFTLNDANDLFDLYKLPETSRFETWAPHKELHESEELARYWVEAQSETPRTEYSLAVTFEGEFIGLCGLSLGFGTETEDSRVGFLGYRLRPDHWGHGIATEAAQGMLRFGFTTLELHRIHTGCSTENVVSLRVLEKLGFRHEGTSIRSFPIEDRWTDYGHYGMLSDEYQAGT